MKVRTFNIHLAPEKMAEDEKILNEFLHSNTIDKMLTEFVSGEEKFWSILIFYKEQTKSLAKTKTKFFVDSENELNEYEKHIFRKLIKWRKSKADESKRPQFLICTNSDLISAIKFRPKKRDDLYNIRGFGRNKIEKIGQELVDIINSYTVQD